MKKQQLILLGSGAVLFCLIYFFGQTIPPRKKSSMPPAQAASMAFNFDSILKTAKEQLTPSQQAYINQMESAVVRGDVKDQQIKVFKQLAAFWSDSAHLILPYLYYTGEAAKLENSEKNLTFAAHKFLEGARQQSGGPLRNWMATEAKGLFEKALELNPHNDSTLVGLGSCYFYGNFGEMPMKGIMMIREVANRDSSNMYAQLMLGLGDMESGQFDKAVDHLSKVVGHEPENIEAVLNLAEAYERMGDKAQAIKWYKTSRKFFDDKQILGEIDKRISQLQQ